LAATRTLKSGSGSIGRVIARDLFASFDASDRNIAKIAHHGIVIAAMINQACRRLHDYASLLIKGMSVFALMLRERAQLFI
jgi:hypothetical protein